MAEMAQKISKTNHQELLDMLNIAFAEEWLAYYQYWIGAYVAKGPMRPEITEEFNEHAEEELKHSKWLAERILQLGGTPIIDPEEWKKHAVCKYEAPVDEYTVKLLEQNLTAEKCAIARYQKICEMTLDKDDKLVEVESEKVEEEMSFEVAADLTDEDRFGDYKSYMKEKQKEAENLGATLEFHVKVGPKRFDSMWYGDCSIATLRYGNYIFNIFGLSVNTYLRLEDGTDLYFDDLEENQIYNDETVPYDYIDFIAPGIEFEFSNEVDDSINNYLNIEKWEDSDNLFSISYNGKFG